MKTPKRKTLIQLGLVLLVIVLFFAWIRHGNPSDRPIADTEGKSPALVEPETERVFPSARFAKTIGWAANEKPVAAAGLTVARFAEGLDHPRTMLTLPNGDVLVAETNAPASSGSGGVKGFFERIAKSFVGAGEASPNRIILLRDADGDGRAEQRFTFRTADLDSPSGMAFAANKLFIANHDAVLMFDFVPGATQLNGSPKLVMDLPPAGNHWMRNLLLSPDNKRLYVAVGSSSNIGENGIDAEQGRAAIWEIDLATVHPRQYANGLRNPNGMAWNPSTGELWTVVNERDQMGPDLPPDYLTNVPIGAQYGWPWVYWKDKIDWRVHDPMPEYMMEYTRKPEYAVGAHTAALGLLFSTGGNLMGERYANGAFIARHGSWNRIPLSGYDVIFVPFDANGNPLGKPQILLGGFMTGNGNKVHGRPTWLAWDKTGALLVSDDTAGVIWRVWAPGASPSVAPKPVVVEPMKPVKELKGDPSQQFRADFKQDQAVQQ